MEVVVLAVVAVAVVFGAMRIWRVQDSRRRVKRHVEALHVLSRMSEHRPTIASPPAPSDTPDVHEVTRALRPAVPPDAPHHNVRLFRGDVPPAAPPPPPAASPSAFEANGDATSSEGWPEPAVFVYDDLRPPQPRVDPADPTHADQTHEYLHADDDAHPAFVFDDFRQPKETSSDVWAAGFEGRPPPFAPVISQRSYRRVRVSAPLAAAVAAAVAVIVAVVALEAGPSGGAHRVVSGSGHPHSGATTPSTTSVHVAPVAPGTTAPASPSTRTGSTSGLHPTTVSPTSAVPSTPRPTAPPSTTPQAPPEGPPVLTSISPRSGAAGQTVTVRGSGFFSRNSLITVSFAGAPSSVACPNQTTCTVTVPDLGSAKAKRAVPVTISTDGGASNALSFLYA